MSHALSGGQIHHWGQCGGTGSLQGQAMHATTGSTVREFIQRQAPWSITIAVHITTLLELDCVCGLFRLT